MQRKRNESFKKKVQFCIFLYFGLNMTDLSIAVKNVNTYKKGKSYCYIKYSLKLMCLCLCVRTGRDKKRDHGTAISRAGGFGKIHQLQHPGVSLHKRWRRCPQWTDLRSHQRGRYEILSCFQTLKKKKWISESTLLRPTRGFPMQHTLYRGWMQL